MYTVQIQMHEHIFTHRSSSATFARVCINCLNVRILENLVTLKDRYEYSTLQQTKLCSDLKTAEASTGYDLRYNRRKIRLIEGNAKRRHLKN